jgi:RHS repeat-associated protein
MFVIENTSCTCPPQEEAGTSGGQKDLTTGNINLIDDLSYTYLLVSGTSLEGHQLNNITDNSLNAAGYNDNGSSDISSYNFNGNPNNDHNQGLSLEYNRLNLSSKRFQNLNNKMELFYSAVGIKYKVKTTISPNVTEIIYTQGIEYRNSSTPSVVHHNYGYVEFNAGVVSHNYTIKDHQGNPRVTFDGSGSIVEFKDYYSFGMLLHNVQLPNSSNKEFGNKERETYSNSLDFEARFYQPEIAKWTMIDAISSYSYSFTPYRNNFNNPITYIDPSGMAEVGRSSSGPSYIPTYEPYHNIDDVVDTRSQFEALIASSEAMLYKAMMLGRGVAKSDELNKGKPINLADEKSPGQIAKVMANLEYYKDKGITLKQLVSFRGFGKNYKISGGGFGLPRYVYKDKKKYKDVPNQTFVTREPYDYKLDYVTLTGRKERYIKVNEVSRDGKPYYEFSVDQKKISDFERKILSGPESTPIFFIHLIGHRGDNYNTSQPIMGFGFTFDELKEFEKYANYIGVANQWYSEFRK